MTTPLVLREIGGQVIGRIVLENRLAFRAHIDQLLDDGVRLIVVDMSNCIYVDSAGCGVLVGVTKRVHDLGGKLVLADLTEDVQRLFELSKIDRVFTIAESVDIAVANLS